MRCDFTHRASSPAQPRKKLNDEVINFCLSMRQLQHAGEARVRFLNTFTYVKITRYMNTSSETIRTWFPKNILSYSLMVFPIHKPGHWVLGVIDLRSQRISVYDSLHGRNGDIAQNLALVAGALLGGPEKAAAWPREFPVVPQQRNGIDCGVFMLTFADRLARGAVFDFAQKDIGQIRQDLMREILEW